MQKFTTDKGTELYWSVKYQLGGLNYFTGSEEPRCYYLIVQRNKQEVEAFSSLDSECGAGKMILIEVSRKSNKQERLAIKKALNLLPKLAKSYDL